MKFTFHQIFEFDDARLNVLLSGTPVPLIDEDNWDIEVFDNERHLEDGARCLIVSRTFIENPDSTVWWHSVHFNSMTLGPLGPLIDGDRVRVSYACWDGYAPAQFEQVEKLLQHSWFARFDGKERVLKLEAEEPAAAALRKALAEEPGEQTFDPTAYPQFTFRVEFVAATREAAIVEGLSYLCSCEYWGDSSDFSWVCGDRLVATITVSCAQIFDIDLLPPRKAGGAPD